MSFQCSDGPIKVASKRDVLFFEEDFLQVLDEVTTHGVVHVENLPEVIVDVSSRGKSLAEGDLPVLCDNEWPVSTVRNGLTSNRWKLLLDRFVCLLPRLTGSHFAGGLLHVTDDELIFELSAKSLLE